MSSTSSSLISIIVVLFISLYIEVGANSENTYSPEVDSVPVKQSRNPQFPKTVILLE